MTKVKVRNNESFEQALRRFQRLVIKSGILEAYKEKSRHMTKSEKRRRRKKDIARRLEFEKLEK